MTSATKAARIALAVAAVAVLALAPPALAARGGGGGGGGGKPGGATGGGTFSLHLMDGDAAPHHYGRLTFDVYTSASRPFVGLRCWQGTTFVASGYVGYFPDYLYDPWFILHSDSWADGVPATCEARLITFDKRGNEQLLTTPQNFPVAP